MMKCKRFLCILLALVLFAGLAAGCSGNPADRCVKIEGDSVSLPSLNLSFSFPDPWIFLSEEELDALLADNSLISSYVDADGNILSSEVTSFSSDKAFAFNVETFESCRFEVTESTEKINLETYAVGIMDKCMEDVAGETSLVQTRKIGRHTAYTLTYVPSATGLHYRYYYFYANDTFVQITTIGQSDPVMVDDIIEA